MHINYLILFVPIFLHIVLLQFPFHLKDLAMVPRQALKTPLLPRYLTSLRVSFSSSHYSPGMNSALLHCMRKRVYLFRMDWISMLGLFHLLQKNAR
jgi:hypothetical protein